MGVGRPSTYSKVIETLRSAERGYVLVDRHSIVPTITGLVVSDFLEEHFPDLTQAEFTASMEDRSVTPPPPPPP
jgi:DNA topoisomerase I